MEAMFEPGESRRRENSSLLPTSVSQNDENVAFRELDNELVTTLASQRKSVSQGNLPDEHAVFNESGTESVDFLVPRSKSAPQHSKPDVSLSDSETESVNSLAPRRKIVPQGDCSEDNATLNESGTESVDSLVPRSKSAPQHRNPDVSLSDSETESVSSEVPRRNSNVTSRRGEYHQKIHTGRPALQSLAHILLPRSQQARMMPPSLSHTNTSMFSRSKNAPQKIVSPPRPALVAERRRKLMRMNDLVKSTRSQSEN